MLPSVISWRNEISQNPLSRIHFVGFLSGRRLSRQGSVPATLICSRTSTGRRTLYTQMTKMRGLPHSRRMEQCSAQVSCEQLPERKTYEREFDSRAPHEWQMLFWQPTVALICTDCHSSKDDMTASWSYVSKAVFLKISCQRLSMKWM